MAEKVPNPPIFTSITKEGTSQLTLPWQHWFRILYNRVGGEDALDLSQVTASTNELNILDGVTATASELNILDGVTATASEINALSGLTATASELNVLDGITSSTSELNILDGVTSNATELNVLDGITTSTSELNTLTGITSTVAELNILDGVIATTSELNKLAGSTVSATNIDRRAITCRIANISTSDNVWIASPYAGTVVTVYATIKNAITTSNATLTVKDQDGNSMGGITIVQSGSAEGDTFSLTPVSNNDLSAGDSIEIETDGGSSTTCEAWITILIDAA